MQKSDLRKLIREVPNFPNPGIQFYDIAPLLQNAEAWAKTIEWMAEQISSLKPTKLAGIESRGFIFAAALSSYLKTGLVLIRKKGKLPWKVQREKYNLEYGLDEIEMHIDAVSKEDRVIVVDDVLATGGTAQAAIQLCKALGSNVIGLQVLLELSRLNGRTKIKDVPLFSLFKEL
jgi:adenine phosphoribosyltransferase